MLNDEICKLREELNNSILSGEDYEKTYKISVELDQLIAEYYRIELDLGKKKKVKENIKRKMKNRNKYWSIGNLILWQNVNKWYNIKYKIFKS